MLEVNIIGISKKMYIVSYENSVNIHILKTLQV